MIGGHSGHSVNAGAEGATIAGGGGAGNPNRVTDNWGTVAGGLNNDAGDAGAVDGAPYATVGGGWTNRALKTAATVAGGQNNTALGEHASIGGGEQNDANGEHSTVAGGYYNEISGAADWASIGGGAYNTASGELTTIGGGGSNTASGGNSTIGGGMGNVVTFAYATIGGGDNNSVGASNGAIGGGTHNVITGTAAFATIGGGARNVITGGFEATVGGGAYNTASGELTTIGGGGSNTASGLYATVGGGGVAADEELGNRATDDWATVGGGYNNQAGDDAGTTGDRPYATVGGGESNTASGKAATIGGGRLNEATDNDATVGGGYRNTASAWSSTVPGGADNVAAGRWSFAAGRQAKANHDGSFVWADSTVADFDSDWPNQFKVRATNGMDVWSNNGLYGLRVDNDDTGTNGDAIRALAQTSLGSNYAAIYAYNAGTSPAIYADSGGTYSGYFRDNIYVAGSFVGSSMALVAVNSGDQPLEAGDLVSVIGVTDPLTGTSQPLLAVQLASAQGPGAIGVMQSKAALAVSEKEGQTLQSAHKAEGLAAHGEYLFLVVQGIAYVKADASRGAIQPGDRLTAAAAPGHARPVQTVMVEGVALSEGAPVVGIALEALEGGTGLIPVFVSLR